MAVANEGARGQLLARVLIDVDILFTNTRAWMHERRVGVDQIQIKR